MPQELNLQDWVSESLQQSRAVGYFPNRFIGKWIINPTPKTIAKFMQDGKLQSGLKRMILAGLEEWTLEQCVLNFPEHFTNQEREAAQWRLDEARRQWKAMG